MGVTIYSPCVHFLAISQNCTFALEQVVITLRWWRFKKVIGMDCFLLYLMNKKKQNTKMLMVFEFCNFQTKNVLKVNFFQPFFDFYSETIGQVWLFFNIMLKSFLQSFIIIKNGFCKYRTFFVISERLIDADKIFKLISPRQNLQFLIDSFHSCSKRKPFQKHFRESP